MDLAALRFPHARDARPASIEERARIAALLAEARPLAAPFEGVMATGSFNTGVAGSLVDRPADGTRPDWRARMLAGR